MLCETRDASSMVHLRRYPVIYSLTNTFEDTKNLDLQGRELQGRRFESTPSPSPLKRQIASLHEDGMPQFTASCSGVVALARANFSSVQL